LKVIFFGSFTPLQGTTTIARALARIPEGVLDVTLVGGGQDHAEVRRILEGRSDVTWHDWVPIEKLPRLVAEHDVCLGIFGATEKALTVVPTKIYQGAAAGCALVTSDTAPHRRHFQGAAVLVAPADDEALAMALVELAGDRARVAESQHAAKARAAAFTPRLSVEQLVTTLVRRSGGETP
jgi:glycosyltransferase involved in cell wall biosynthesis